MVGMPSGAADFCGLSCGFSLTSASPFQLTGILHYSVLGVKNVTEVQNPLQHHMHCSLWTEGHPVLASFPWCFGCDPYHKDNSTTFIGTM
jgi:hypothetical protein